MPRLLRLLIVLALVLTSAVPLSASAFRAGGTELHPYIVTFSGNSVQAEQLARTLERLERFTTDRIYNHAIKGFSAQLSSAQVAALSRHPAVEMIVQDQQVELFAQTAPTGIQRVGSLNNGLANIDGVDNPMDIDVAVIDTGIALNHPDLNVVGGYNCTSSRRTGDYADQHGHGTHVAGTIAARDNDIGVVGVAPGARLHAVKVFADSGSGLLSWFICGVDWVAANSSTIEVANFSGGWSGSNSENCGVDSRGRTTDTPHRAICNLVLNNGVPLIVAAGNSGQDATLSRPGTYPEVITVGALADSDGLPGGIGPSTWAGADDTVASFSNFGPRVDVYAPGVDILSTHSPAGYVQMSGTSMAAPHVTGAATLYLLSNPNTTPEQLRQALVSIGEVGSWASQPLINVGSLAPVEPIHDVAVTEVAATGIVSSGTTATVTVEVENLGNQPEQVSVALTENGNTIGAPQSIQLAPSAIQTVNFSWQPSTTGTRTLVGSATITNTDEDPTNNSAQTTVQVTEAFHDVAVTGVTAASPVAQGQASSVQVTVQNMGTYAEVASVSLSSQPTGGINPAAQNVSLDPGETKTVTFNWGTNSSTPATSYSITATVSIAGDSNAGNNSGNATVQVTAAPAVPEVWVDEVSVTGSTTRHRSTIQTSVRLDSTNGPLANVYVQIQLTGPGTNSTRTVRTNSNGVAEFSTAVRRSGTYTATVTAVSAAGYDYNVSKNVMTSSSVNI